MAGDYTKFTFNPHKDYSGVLKQQGRADLDADWNELIEIIDRRWRAETMDIIGRSVVPLATTPNAFLITPTGLGTFNIGIGRMYVDGLQPECHGIAPPAYDATLGEPVGSLPVPYDNQPYFPSLLPPPPISTSAGKIDLVFLDVWQREVTAIEDPKIQEIALGGPDTDTRVQTAWQVRVLQRVDQSGCSDRIPAWDALTAPSAGRLTTAAVAPPASEDECVISPAGGYKGLENRLYRVEIHTPGTIGGASPARFKWSRDNASIASAVEVISAGRDQITVKRIGRDPVLRFQVGDWIEVLDDYSEFKQQPGQMVNVTQIDEANRILTVAPALPIGAFDAGNLSRHTRVRRWDQRTGVSPATGLLDMTAGPIQVEDGIQITFGLAPAGNFRVGDYWVFAARTADGSVEVLQNAPPRGILHHYCRLGFITWGATLAATKFDDCRQFWPPACCGGGCTVTVGDGIDSHGDFSDLQAAIDSLGNPGGVVCIGRGVFPIAQPIQISGKRNVIIRGAGPATRILFNPVDQNQNLFEIQRADHITIEALFAASAKANALVRISQSSFCTIRECTLVNLNLSDPGQAKMPHSGRAIEFDQTCVNSTIRDNALLAAKGIVSSGQENEIRDLQIRDNRTLCRQVAILLRETTGLEIFHNQLRGLDIKKWGELSSGEPLSRSSIDGFQNQVTQAFASATSTQEFQAAGILLFSGRHVVIRDNWIVAQIGILPFLLLDGSISGNQIFALISILLIYGVVVRISDNLLLGLLAGLLHAGILANLNCGENTFIGFNGITIMSLSELLLLVGPILVLALGSSGISSSADAMIVDFLGEAKVDLKAFGLTLVLKIHRNVFLSFDAGISKSERVISADVSVIDNTFAVCRQVGIQLGFGQQGTALLESLNFRHLIQANAFKVSGKAIVSGCALTKIHDNSIFCEAIGIELKGESSRVQGNFITGSGEKQADHQGLIMVHVGAGHLSIVDNRLVRGPGHGILIGEGIIALTIERNSIEAMRGNGISTVNEHVSATNVDIIGNRIEACRGNGWHRGAIVLGTATGLRVNGNVLANNIFDGGSAHAIYVYEVVNAEINGNVIAANAPIENALGTQTGAIRLQLASGDVQIQNNAVRDNGGSALMIGDGEGAQEYRLLVQNNYFGGNLLQTSALVVLVGAQSAHYQGNQSFQTRVSFYQPSVDIRAVRAIVTGNTVQCDGFWAKLQITALGTPAVRCAVVTSNLVSGGPFAGSYNLGRLSMANNLNL